MDQDTLRRTLLLEVHAMIDAAAAAGLAMVENGGIRPAYPPGVELTDAERAALATLHLPAAARSALEKILRDVAAQPLFDLFALVDGVVDPSGSEAGDPWLGASIVERQEGDDAMWHDALFETYWDWPGARVPGA
jgi:hypothetical protein